MRFSTTIEESTLTQPAAYTALGEDTYADIVAISESRAKLEESAKKTNVTPITAIAYWAGLAVSKGADDVARRIIELATDAELDGAVAEFELFKTRTDKLFSILRSVQSKRNSNPFPWKPVLILSGLALGAGLYIKSKRSKNLRGLSYSMEQHATSAGRDVANIAKIYEKFSQDLREGLCHRAHDRMLDIFATTERFSANVLAAGKHFDPSVLDTINETLYQAKDAFNEHCELTRKKSSQVGPWERRRYPHATR